MGTPGTETVKAARRKKIAECIVDSITTNGNNEQAERLVLMMPGGNDGGGWSRDTLVARIANMLTQLSID